MCKYIYKHIYNTFIKHIKDKCVTNCIHTFTDTHITQIVNTCIIILKTCLNAFIKTYINTCANTYINTCINTCMNTFIKTLIEHCLETFMNTRIYKHMF